MWFRRRRPGSEDDAVAGSAVASAEPETVRSPGLRRVLERLFRDDKIAVLDLGPMCGSSVVDLAGRGARVSVVAFAPPEPIPKAEPGKPAPEPAPYRIDHPDATFDLVLLWERVDFVSPDRLVDFGREIARVLKVGGWILALSSSRKEPTRSAPRRVRIVGDDRVALEPSDERQRPRWAHPNRNLERALDGISIQGIHLHRDGLRELVGVKGGGGR